MGIKSIRLLNKRFEVVELKQFFDSTISAFNASENGAVVVTTNGALKSVYAIDSKGDFAFDGNVSENIKKTDIRGEYIFLQTASGVIRIDVDSKKKDYLPSSQGDMLVYSEDTAIICGYSKAEYLVFD